MSTPVLALAAVAIWASAGPAQEQKEAAPKPDKVDCATIDKKIEGPRPSGTDRARFTELMKPNGVVERKEDEDIIDRVIRDALYELTDPAPKKRQKIDGLREQLLLYVRDATGRPKPDSVRKPVVRAMVKYAPELFDNHCMVRLNAMVLLTALPLEDLESAVRPMLAQIRRADQTDEVKYHACVGLERLAEHRFLNIAGRNESVVALKGLLDQRRPLQRWTQMKLLDALGAITRRSAITSGELEPALQSLTETLRDPEGYHLVSATSARTASEADCSSVQLNVPFMAHETAALCARLGRQYVEQLDKVEGTEEMRYWQMSFALLVMSFRGEPKAQGSDGWLHKAAEADKPYVKQAEQLVVAVVKKVLEEELAEDITGAVATLDEWVNKNPPAQRRVTPNLPDFKQSAQLATTSKEPKVETSVGSQ